MASYHIVDSMSLWLIPLVSMMISGDLLVTFSAYRGNTICDIIDPALNPK